MSPRPYQLGQRQTQIDESRQRVVDSARALLAESERYTAFTVDAVAKRADVARATVYYQFGSKAGLIEALCDSLGAAGGLDGLPAVFAEPDPHVALAGLIDRFARFWSADRIVMRRLRALAVLDPDVGAVISARDDRLRAAIGAILARIPNGPAAADVVYALTRFETFDALAGPAGVPTDAVATVGSLVEAALASGKPARRQPRR
jgi:AcrR family transcriptional regulator